MDFEWDENKSNSNKTKHGIDFSMAKLMWDDTNRVEIEAPYPLERRGILIAKIGKNLWTAIFTLTLHKSLAQNRYARSMSGHQETLFHFQDLTVCSIRFHP
jgi:uncharacterized DUF497 family protein